MSLSAIPRLIRDHVAERDGGQCRYCRLKQVGQTSIFHINHVVPRSKGGTTEEANLVLQCPYCSLHKSNKAAAPDPIKGVTVALFHPLRERCEDHFLLDADGTCRGKTPTGRATIVALAMNDAIPHMARRLQIRVGLLHPSS